MTKQCVNSSHTAKAIITSLSIIIFAALSFFLSDEISFYALEGLKLAFNVIIPTAFPFMIFTDFVTSYIDPTSLGGLSSISERFFKINRYSISAIICGLLGGFPIGARASLNLYQNGIIQKDECERLASFSNLPSIAYTVFAIGAVGLSSFKIGLLLYFITLTSSLISGLIMGINKSFSNICCVIPRQRFSFVNSIKSASTASVHLAFFISFFSVICGFISIILDSTILKCILFSLLEVGNACKFISESCNIGFGLKIAFIAFSLSFSGLSVIFQGLSFAKPHSVSAIKITLQKLLQGVIAFIICILISLVNHIPRDLLYISL